MKLYGNKSQSGKRSLAVFIALVLVICVAVGGTIAFIVAKTGEVRNTFTPADVEVKIVEIYANNEKSSITVQNVQADKNVPSYIRVRLVSNLQDAEGNVTGSAAIADFDLGDKWFDGSDGCYYYKDVVMVGDSTGNLLANGEKITLQDGQVVEVLAEGIQATPADAVHSAWGVTVADDGTISK